jgi:type IV pilus assembly protein PilB
VNQYSDKVFKAEVDATVVDVTEIFEEVPPQFNDAQNPVAENLNRAPEQDESPSIGLVNKVLIMGMREKASEIHLEPEENKLVIRIRQGGNLRSLLDPLPKKMITPIINRLKVMVGLDITQTKIPQKGRLRKSYNGNPVYFFIHTLPSFYGEKIVVRIVESLTELPDLETLISDTTTQTAIKALNKRKSGLILVTGPAYSGISSTLEALLAQQQKQELNLATVEDPIRRTFPGITQVEVDRERGFTYAQALDSLARQDMDVIMVEQMEDWETAQAVLDSVNQGHLLLTSLSAQDAVSAIAQLTEWVKPSYLAENLSGIINQRLLRRVCPTCRLVHQPEKEELQQLQLSARQRQSSHFYRANTLNQELIQQYRLKGRLCRQCNGAGYYGQVGVYEVLTINPSLRSLIAQNTDPERLREAVLAQGMKTLINDALDQVLAGETTLEEFFRVFPDALFSLGQVQPVATLSPDFQKRLTDLEKSLADVNKAFVEFKKLMTATSPELNEEFTDESDEFSPQTLPLMALDDAEIDLSEVTLISDTQLYEEFANPEKWGAFKKEVTPRSPSMTPKPANSTVADLKSELAIDEFLLPDDENEGKEDTVIAPFKSIVDPW